MKKKQALGLKISLVAETGQGGPTADPAAFMAVIKSGTNPKNRFIDCEAEGGPFFLSDLSKTGVTPLLQKKCIDAPRKKQVPGYAAFCVCRTNNSPFERVLLYFPFDTYEFHTFQW